MYDGTVRLQSYALTMLPFMKVQIFLNTYKTCIYNCDNLIPITNNKATQKMFGNP